MKKISGYQKLKAENAKLRHDIYKLVMEPDQHPVLRTDYKMLFEQEKNLWLGSSKGDQQFNGFLKTIQP
jgi:hypothetical protein